MSDLLLTVYLHPPVLQTAQAGKLGILNRIRALLETRGWQIRIERSGPDARAQAPDRPGHALFNMERPTHDRALTFRLAYHYPYWRLERVAERRRRVRPLMVAGFSGAHAAPVGSLWVRKRALVESASNCPTSAWNALR